MKIVEKPGKNKIGRKSSRSSSHSNIKTARESYEEHLVLIVDDEEANCKVISEVIGDEGFASSYVCSGEEAVKFVARYRPAVVFLDIWMPGMDGIAALGKIKEISSETEVIIISGHATISNAVEATRMGAFDFIEKPLDIDTITQTLRQALARSPLAPQEINHYNKPLGALSIHPGVNSCGLAGKDLGQRTLAKGVILYGYGLHSGQKSGLRIEPLPRDSGIHFLRLGSKSTITAFVDSVDNTAFATTINGKNSSISTIEHLMSALHAYGITNALITCNSEVPIFDGSANSFCEAFDDVGVEEQGGGVACDSSFSDSSLSRCRFRGIY